MKPIPARQIPLSKPTKLGSEIENIKKLLDSDHQLAGGGSFNKACEAAITAILGPKQPHVLMTTSCTHALEMCALLLDLRPGDEIVMPSFTFVSTANAFLLHGGKPVFVDNDRNGNIDITAVQRAITRRTRAVIGVNYAGCSCDMTRLKSLCDARKIVLIEDAAQSLGGKCDGQALGTFGTFACISFHDTKNVTAGEGGALVISDENYLKRAEIMREKGTNRSQFIQGLVDKYTWVDVGSSYVLSELNAAFLLPQLENLDRINARRKEIWLRYKEDLSEKITTMDASLLEIPAQNTSNYHLFGFVFENPNARDKRDKFIAAMKEQGVMTPFHYVALHASPMGRRFSMPDEKYENCTRLSEGLVRLPLYYNMSDEDVAWVSEAVRACPKII